MLESRKALIGAPLGQYGAYWSGSWEDALVIHHDELYSQGVLWFYCLLSTKSCYDKVCGDGIVTHVTMLAIKTKPCILRGSTTKAIFVYDAYATILFLPCQNLDQVYTAWKLLLYSKFVNPCCSLIYKGTGIYFTMFILCYSKITCIYRAKLFGKYH